MIDIRPLSTIVPLEVERDGRCEIAGLADMTPDLKFDLAADQAISIVLERGLFIQSNLETFDYVYYWKTFHGMVVDFRERWQDEIIVSKEVFGKAETLYKQNYPHARLRLPMQMKLGKYLKI
jgi:hypothetical protein